jgi:hypothetical protein
MLTGKRYKDDGTATYVPLICNMKAQKKKKINKKEGYIAHRFQGKKRVDE